MSRPTTHSGGSRGGLTTKVLLAVEAGRKPLAMVLTRHEQNRAFATRYDKLAVRYDATVEMTNINIYLRAVSNRA